MDRLYYLTDEHFEPINRRLPSEDSGRGRPPRVKNREALEGILYILCTGTPVAGFAEGLASGTRFIISAGNTGLSVGSGRIS